DCLFVFFLRGGPKRPCTRACRGGEGDLIAWPAHRPVRRISCLHGTTLDAVERLEHGRRRHGLARVRPSPQRAAHPAAPFFWAHTQPAVPPPSPDPTGKRDSQGLDIRFEDSDVYGGAALGPDGALRRRRLRPLGAYEQASSPAGGPGGGPAGEDAAQRARTAVPSSTPDGAGALQNRYLIPAATTFEPFGASAPKKPDRWWIRPTIAHSGYLGSAKVTSNKR